MKTSVLISIRPEWVYEILNGKKTIEIRKTKPQIKTPFKIYIYCTKAGKKIYDNREGIFPNFSDNIDMCGKGEMNGKVVAEFTCNKIEKIDLNNYYINSYDVCTHIVDTTFNENYVKLLNKSCLTLQECDSYLKNKTGYAWYISDLKIYNKPKYLWEFKSIQHIVESFKDYYKELPLKIPPQSWQYVVDETCEEKFIINKLKEYVEKLQDRQREDYNNYIEYCSVGMENDSSCIIYQGRSEVQTEIIIELKKLIKEFEEQ